MLRLLVHLHTLIVTITGPTTRRAAPPPAGHRPARHRPTRRRRTRHRPPGRPAHRRLLFDPPRCLRVGGDGGQTTVEYALVLLGAAAIAVLLITWASKSGAIGRLFDAVMSSVLGSVK